MSKMLLILFLVFGLSIMSGSSYGQGLYKWVDEKGTVHFSDNPTSGVFNPKSKEPPKENTNEILKGIEVGNRHIPKEQMILYHQRSTEEAAAERQLKAIKDQQEEMQLRRNRAAEMLEKEGKKGITVKDHKGKVIATGITKGQQEMLREAARLRSGSDLGTSQEELQVRRDRAADMLEKEARKETIVRDHKGNVIGRGMTQGQQEMLRDAARLRSGVDLEPSPPPSDNVKKWERKARQAEIDASHKRNEARQAESRARDAESRARDAENKARHAERDAAQKARIADTWR